MFGPVVRVCEQVGSKSKSSAVLLIVSRYGQFVMASDCFDMLNVGVVKEAFEVNGDPVMRLRI